MKEEYNEKKKTLLILIESIENDNILEYLLTYISLVLKRWG